MRENVCVCSYKDKERERERATNERIMNVQKKGEGVFILIF